MKRKKTERFELPGDNPAGKKARFDLQHLTLVYDRSAQKNLGYPTAALWLLRYEFLTMLHNRRCALNRRVSEHIFRLAVRETADGKLELLPIARWGE
ncbi:hypothetical protein [Rhizobium leguminosarum]|uniref:hypothetical protein n=1 Tax=Rhizobium leguminosarum TaxID=384 RepID=UPI0013BBD5AB|nr:hypothetical protein [Rhizobium leguminosarum]MBY5324442.1 hypothetical protein [Rhizobium leguminosarum]MBY5385722.1 hypothetical protein [Rhizobium leguminosarum]MCA2436036.1 hypothetical protein [Rhizobium leguminosarum]NEH74046.1 hypothetical protein [Rhizobium leguminosarum]